MSLIVVNDDRHFKNSFQDYSVQNAIQYISSNNISDDFKAILIRKIGELCSILDNSLNELSSKDISIYTGLSGIAYFYFTLSSCNIVELNSVSKKSRKTCVSLVDRCLRHLRNKPGSFICDDTGPLTLSVILGVDDRRLTEILNMADYIINNETIPNEMLYGRCGYLFALLLLNKHGFDVPKDLIKRVFQVVIKSGRDLANIKREIIDNTPLFYEWHDKPYLGAAHGMAGIMFMLLQVYLEPSLHDLNSEIKHEIYEFVLPTIKYLATCRLPSGNYPSSLGDSSTRDVLVHWCHGATGWVHMFIAAYKVNKDKFYLERVIEIADVIWSRGLLHKGCGLCHGAAGNGLAFLAIYQCTNDPKYLYRALKFSEWCMDCFKNRTREADRPYSLFEGLAGTILFLVNCLDPKSAKFPAYEL